MRTYPTNQALVNAIKHAKMQNGEVVIKVNGELITGHIQTLQINMDPHQNTFEIKGTIR